MKNLSPLLFGFLFLLLQLVVFRILGVWSDWAKILHSDFWNFHQNFVGEIGHKIPFSIGDVLYIIICVFLFYKGISIVFSSAKISSSFSKKNIAKLMFLLNFLVFFYVLVWGFNYYKKSPFDSYSEVIAKQTELKKLANELLLSASELRKLSKEDELGVYKLSENSKHYYKELEKSFLKQVWKNQYKIPKKKNQKASLFSTFMGYFGVGGYYNPFTTEAQYNKLLPDSKKLFVFSHEFAHQMGFAKEGEANFVAYKLLNSSENPSWQYQAKLRALFYVLHDISKRDSVFAKQIIKEFSPAMSRDLENEKKFRNKYKSFLSDYFSKINDVFLQLNNQKEGRKSYGLFVNYLVAERRKENK